MFFKRFNMGCIMRKPVFCTSENKGADQRCDCFTTYIVFSLYFINPKLEASSHGLWLYSLVCDRPGRKPMVFLQCFSFNGFYLIEFFKIIIQKALAVSTTIE